MIQFYDETGSKPEISGIQSTDFNVAGVTDQHALPPRIISPFGPTAEL